ncbi:MAG: phosphoenolpyruvate mutase [Alphaproteobacteria bacterium]|nr:phosphoenolpyruvate mutase [Alphaproteobacteria bacterium]
MTLSLREPARPESGQGPRSKAAALKSALLSPELAFLMEAHNGLSARIVEESGFKGIWASGLSMSAALGVRDNNEASWTQVLEVLEFMADATTIPILVDGDTGYGNFNNVRRLVKKLCQRGIAGVCIEDKLFPKTNSFIGDGQPLADIDEFCGKIKAGKDSQSDPDFCLVARVEALISGWGLDEALRRADAYHRAGADGILIHSKRSTADEIFAFCKEWGNRCPVVIVPTMYHATPTERYRAAGISCVIWANHNVRAAITAMREVSRKIAASETLVGVEGGIASVKDVFELSGNPELAEAERRYLPQPGSDTAAVVLAASRGAALGELTADRPKCMIDVRGQPLLRRQISTLKDSGIRQVSVVVGYRKEAVDLPSIELVPNDAYASTGECASLALAEKRLVGPCLITYGDILFRRYILDRLLEADGDIVVVADALWRERRRIGPGMVHDHITCSRPFSAGYLDEDTVDLVRAASDLPDAAIHGEWVGLAKLSAEGAALARHELAAMRADGTLGAANMPDLFNRLVAGGHRVRVQYITGHWLDVDDAFDLAKARNFL